MTRSSLLLLALLSFGAAAVGPCATEPLGSLATDGASAPHPDAAAALPSPGATPATADAGAPGVAPAVRDGGAPSAAPATCASRTASGPCLAAGCRWLAPGCDLTRALPAPGCYASAEVDCASDAACPPGKGCVPRVIDPCFIPPGSPPGGAACAACGALVMLCQ